MNTDKYLERIKYKDSSDPSLNVLKQLQAHHLLHIPFENLDIYYGKKIELDKTYNKIVINNRGGFCYELNGLFYQLLEYLGFKVKLISARVYNKEKGFGPEFDHMAIIAEVDEEKYLVDVGFGEFAFSPLKIELDTIQADPRGNFVIQQHEKGYLQVSKKEEGQLVSQYLFSEIKRQPEEFLAMCYYHQTSSDSHFTQKRMCSLPTEHGRITITGDVLKIKEDGKITERQFKDEAAFHQALWGYFKIKL